MSEDIVVRQCAPTLAGLKTGSLFPCPYESKQALMKDVRKLNQILVPKGLCLLPLRLAEKQALLYLYRPRELERDLTDQMAAELLRKAGYPPLNSERCVVRLIQRLAEEKEFPHEIGLFLSYPPEDVKGFIENKASNSKCVGTWKVYGNVERAQELFAQFKRCTDIYCKLWQAGSSLEQLAVAV